MSLIITVHVPTGIVISGDSRTTYRKVDTPADPKAPDAQGLQHTDLVLSDATNKVFLVHGQFGIGAVGDAIINNLPIAHYVEDFEAQTKAHPPLTTQDCATTLLAHFRRLTPLPGTNFHVVGYNSTDPWVIEVNVRSNTTNRLNFAAGSVQYGVTWSGDTSITTRLLSQNLPPFNLMNVQDAVDFSRHLIRTTIDQMRFETRFPTVGGPIDTLMVSGKGAQFLAKKEIGCKV